MKERKKNPQKNKKREIENREKYGCNIKLCLLISKISDKLIRCGVLVYYLAVTKIWCLSLLAVFTKSSVKKAHQTVKIGPPA